MHPKCSLLLLVCIPERREQQDRPPVVSKQPLLEVRHLNVLTPAPSGLGSAQTWKFTTAFAQNLIHWWQLSRIFFFFGSLPWPWKSESHAKHAVLKAGKVFWRCMHAFPVLVLCHCIGKVWDLFPPLGFALHISSEVCALHTTVPFW